MGMNLEDNEKVKTFKLFDGKYEVTDNGKVISYIRKYPKEMIGKITNSGYRMVLLYDNDGNRIYKNVHRLVAEAFIPNPDNLPEVNHKDGNKLNNHVHNLEWTTSKQNKLHCRDCIGSKNQKITFEQANQIRKLKNEGMSNSEISKLYGIKKSQIGYIMQNKRWCINEDV